MAQERAEASGEVSVSSAAVEPEDAVSRVAAWGRAGIRVARVATSLALTAAEVSTKVSFELGAAGVGAALGSVEEYCARSTQVAASPNSRDRYAGWAQWARENRERAAERFSAAQLTALSALHAGGVVANRQLDLGQQLMEDPAELRDTWRALQQFGELIREFNAETDDASFLKLMGGLMALAQLHQAHGAINPRTASHVRAQRAMAAGEPPPPLTSDEVHRVRGLLAVKEFMEAAYGAVGMALSRLAANGRGGELDYERVLDLRTLASDERLHLAEHTGIQPEDVLYSQETSTLRCPAHYVCVDRHRCRVVVVLRGTLSVRDLLTDLTARPLRVPPHGCVHGGMFASAQELAAGPLLRAVEGAMEGNEGFALELVGHSLGGGVAALLALLWRERWPGVHAFAFGAPCVCDLPLSLALEPHVTSVCMGDDVVNRLGLGTIRDTRDAAIALASDNEVLMRCWGLGGSPPAGEEEEQWLQSVVNGLCATMQDDTKLYPPGAVFWLTQREADEAVFGRRGAASIRRMDNAAFGEILFSPAFFEDHHSPVYSATLASVIIPPAQGADAPAADATQQAV
eukprot:CAMPEP_0183797628 /NCGR_PEP_ID=MMETSP0803_2-20130417/16442_1 /TAXON_ID=195967 /ORGANISM="Crustomastix stigmata, Strain CCMP3273" /LENGTH=573 /DNA_ID=CAMNT_0026042301 /DNA_START=93 /DNA_END=1814 /DNA_ORIENTATION=+